MNTAPLRIGLAGFGTVGSGLARIFAENKELLQERSGREMLISSILVSDMSRQRAYPFPEGAKVTDNLDDFINDPSLDLIVEVIGGTTTAGDIISKALKAGKHVVTANKALLAETGNKFFALAAEKNLRLGFEASVCGGIPVIETFRNSMAANEIKSMMGILNGTSNYILSEMSSKGVSFAEALKDAQDLGFAEADPTLDIEGFDAAHKLALLIRLAWGVDFPFDQVNVKGISEVASKDIEFAERFGYRIKLIGHAKKHDKGIEAAVFPAFVQEAFLLSSVGGAYNALRIHGNAVGSLFLHGKGAGDLPTGSAVAADIVDIARGTVRDNCNLSNIGYVNLPKATSIMPAGEVHCPFYLRLTLTDKAGTLRDIAGIMSDNNISIAQAIQTAIPGAKEARKEGEVPPVHFTIMTHKAKVNDVLKAVDLIANSPMVHEKPIIYRVLAREDNI